MNIKIITFLPPLSPSELEKISEEVVTPGIVGDQGGDYAAAADVSAHCDRADASNESFSQRSEAHQGKNVHIHGNCSNVSNRHIL